MRRPARMGFETHMRPQGEIAFVSIVRPRHVDLLQSSGGWHKGS